jgi:transcriptional regulator with XRE-family HTH domain
MGYETFEKLCNSRGITPYSVSKATGITTATLTSWKKGRYTPKAEKLQKIADYFGVTLEYITTGREPLPEDAPSYFFDEEAKEAARFLHDNPQYKVLFQASQKVRPEDIGFIKEMIERASK